MFNVLTIENFGSLNPSIIFLINVLTIENFVLMTKFGKPKKSYYPVCHSGPSNFDSFRI
jgi:hypothetical protein